MLPKKTLLIWLLIATINSTCDEGCVRCGEDNKCLTCDLQLGWKLVGDSCQRSVDTKCILNGAQDSCLQCNQNFFYDATQRKCVRSSRRLPLCLHMQDNVLCDVCVKGYYPLDGVCTLIPNPIENCKYHRDNERCMQCEEGYWPSSNFKKCLKDPNSEKIENCKYYSNLYCQKCDNDTVPNPNTYLYNLFSKPDIKKYQNYVQNKQFQYSDNVIDSQCEQVQVQYCKEYKSAIECSKCNNGYYLKEGKCIVNPFTIIEHCIVYASSNQCLTCEPQYYPHNSQSECKKSVNDILNCQIRNLNSCLQCYDGYYKNGSACTEQVKIDNCQTYKTDAPQCQECVESYRLTSDNLKCLLEIPNCKTYASSNQNDIALTCTACTNSTYLDTDKQCVSGNVVNCLDYQTNGQQCQKCVNGYYLSGNQCIAHMTIDNCSIYSNSLKNTCVQCETNYFLFNLQKLCYAAFEILHCLQYSDRDNCSECEQGYFLENNECKLIPEEENCLKRGLANTDCQLCKEGYYINSNVSPKTCLKEFEQQDLGCFTDSTDTHTDRHLCSVCKGSHYFVDIEDLSNQTTFEGNICGKIDRIPESQRVENCIAYIDSGTDDWKCLKCQTGFYLSDVSGNSGDYGDTCSDTCSGTIKVIDVNHESNTSDNPLKLDKFRDFNINKCITNLTAPNDECEYWVPINKTSTDNEFDYECGKLKDTSNMTLKLNYNAGMESPYGFQGDFTLLNQFGYAAPTYDIDDTTISASLPSTDQDKCQSWKINGAGLGAGLNNKYCDKCVHQYTSSVFINDSNEEEDTIYLKCDKLIPDCETDVLGGFSNDYQAFIRHSVNPMHVSCHSCSSQNQIPFIHLPLDGDAKWTNKLYQPFKVEETTDVPKDSPVKDGLVTQCREPTPQGLAIDVSKFTREFPSNCGMGLYNIQISKTFQDTDALTDVSIFCLVCKPGFKAVYDNDGFLSNCEEIANCKKTDDESVNKFVNGCAQCDLGYNYRMNNTSKKIDFDECVPQVVPNCLVSEGENCVYCRKGFYLENNKTCNKLIVPKCTNYNYVDYEYHNIYDGNTNILQSQISFAIYLSTFNKGCLQCTSNYYQLYKYPVEQKQCVSSQNLIEQQYENSDHLILHCALYQGNEVKKCYRCNSLYIPNSDNTKCIEQTPFYRCARVNEVSAGQFVCTECEQNFYLVKNKCRRGTIENCITYDPDTLPMQCSTCANTYRVSRDNQSCVPGNLPYCNEYENQFETSCKTCQNLEHPLVEANNTNVTVKRCFRDLNDFNCQEVNADEVKDSIYQCDKCQQGYYQADPDDATSKNMCVSISPIQHCKTYDYVADTRYSDRTHKCLECNSGFYVSEYGYSCKVRDPSVEFCLVFSPNSLECQTCQEGYFLSSDKMICYPNPTGVKYCEQYSSATTCLRCSAGYYLNNNKCLEVEDNLAVKGCIQYNEEQLCVQCNQNYYFDSTNNTCNDPNASGCLTYTDINTCDTCPEGTVFQEVQQGDTIIRNCIDFNLQFCLDINPETRKCNLCATSYFAQEDGTCSVAQLIPNCLYYETEFTCQQCEDGFYRTSDKKECFQTGFNLMNSQSTCIDVVYKEEQQCVACEDGMYFEDGKCVACKVENCLACDPRTPTQCLICQSGYTQKNQYGNCDINLKENIVLPGEDDGTDGDNEEYVKILTSLTLLLVTLFN